MWRVDGRPATDWPVDDRGLAYGDGVFETVAVVDGTPALWPDHRHRLTQGCRRLGFQPPATAHLDDEVNALAGSGHGVIKLLVTRGRGGRGYAPPSAPRPRIAATRTPMPARPGHWWRHGVRVHRCRTELAVQPALAGLKHLNRLEQVLARGEWQDPEIAEGLMADTGGQIVEGTVTNLFARYADKLLTPPVHRCGVAGVMRRRVIGVAREIRLRPRVAPLWWDDLIAADELWLCNSLIGLWPVRELAGRVWSEFALARRCLAILTERRWIAVPAEGDTA